MINLRDLNLLCQPKLLFAQFLQFFILIIIEIFIKIVVINYLKQSNLFINNKKLSYLNDLGLLLLLVLILVTLLVLV